MATNDSKARLMKELDKHLIEMNALMEKLNDKKLRGEIQRLKNELMASMASDRVSECASPYFKFRRKKATTRKILDPAKVRASGLYDAFVKEVKVKASLQIEEIS